MVWMNGTAKNQANGTLEHKKIRIDLSLSEINVMLETLQENQLSAHSMQLEQSSTRLPCPDHVKEMQRYCVVMAYRKGHAYGGPSSNTVSPTSTVKHCMRRSHESLIRCLNDDN